MGKSVIHDHPITFYMSSTITHKIDKAAKSIGISRSDFIRIAVMEKLEKSERVHITLKNI